MSSCDDSLPHILVTRCLRFNSCLHYDAQCYHYRNKCTVGFERLGHSEYSTGDVLLAHKLDNSSPFLSSNP